MCSTTRRTSRRICRKILPRDHLLEDHLDLNRHMKIRRRTRHLLQTGPRRNRLGVENVYGRMYVSLPSLLSNFPLFPSTKRLTPPLILIPVCSNNDLLWYIVEL